MRADRARVEEGDWVQENFGWGEARKLRNHKAFVITPRRGQTDRQEEALRNLQIRR